ncbi:putative inner membrane transporter YicL [Brevibacillus laterosporus]|nr:putative inner membrane transporter YicL [Brevibacillus laterosporus]
MKVVARNRMKGMIMVVTGAGLWGISGTVAQQLFQQVNISTEWLVTVRLLISGMILLLLSSCSPNRYQIFGIWKHKNESIKILLFGVLGMLGVQYTYFASINEGNAAVATLLQYLAPIFITFYLIIKCKNIPTKKDAVSILLALLGTFLLLTNGSTDNLTVSKPAIIWGILSGLSLAFYTLYSKGLLEKWASSIVVGWGMIIGGIGLTILHFISTKKFVLLARIENVTLEAFLLIGFVVIFGTLIAFYLYLESIRYITPKETSLLGCTEPLAAIITSVLFLHVPFGFFQSVGTLSVLIMVFLLSQKPSPSEKQSNIIDS